MSPEPGTEANHLYYTGDRPPTRTTTSWRWPSRAWRAWSVRLAAPGCRSMAFDLLQSVARRTLPGPGHDGRRACQWTEAPMTEAQVASWARRGVVPDRELTWVQASLLIDGVTDSRAERRRRGGCAKTAPAR